MNTPNIPNLPKNFSISPSSILSDAEKLIKVTDQQKQREHDYKVAIFSIIGGGIMGFITSAIFWLITNQY